MTANPPPEQSGPYQVYPQQPQPEPNQADRGGHVDAVITIGKR